MELAAYLKLMADKGASDLFLSTGAPVMMKVEGHTSPITQKHLPAGIVRELAYSIMNDKQRAEFEKKPSNWTWPSGLIRSAVFG